MIGKFLRFKIAIVMAILGLLVLGTGIGQRTIWLPPATLTASVSSDVKAAPLTVIGPELLKTRDGRFTLTVKNDGPIQLAVGRVDDIAGWLGDAAHTSIGAANEDFTSLTAESTGGVEKVPNPSGSDMWVTEEKATGELNYTWQSPGRGDWALLLSTDGTAPAPTDISITADNETGTPWAIPLIILGSILLALAALLFLVAPRKSRAAEVGVGRRSAGRAATDPATGALEVDKIVAARSAAQAKTTIAQAQRAESGPLVSDSSADSDTAAKAAAAGDATASLPASLRSVEADPANQDTENTVNPAPEDSSNSAPSVSADDSNSSASTDEGSVETGTTEISDITHITESDSESNSGSKSDSDSPSGSGGVGPAPKSASGRNAKAAKKPGKKQANKQSPANDTVEEGDKSEFQVLPPAKIRADTPARELQRVKKPFTMKARWGAMVAAVLLAGSVSPAVADDASTPAPAPSPTATEESSTAGFPNLVDSQVQRIAESVATVVASGDNAKNAQELQSRVAGMALEVRTANYKIRASVEKQPAVEPVNATKLLAKVVTTTETWPRSAMFVTQGENNTLPQLLTLVQESPRENYKLTKATPLLPGQTFPTVDKEGTKVVTLDSSEGLKMSPEAAITALSDRLTNEDSKFKDSFTENVYLTNVFDLQKKVAADAKDASYVFSHKANKDTVVSMRTADGGAMVVVGYTFGIDATSKAEATLTVGEDAAVFTGGRETTKGFNLNYAEPVVMYIPPAAGDGKITVLSATRNLVSGAFK